MGIVRAKRSLLIPVAATPHGSLGERTSSGLQVSAEGIHFHLRERDDVGEIALYTSADPCIGVGAHAIDLEMMLPREALAATA